MFRATCKRRWNKVRSLTKLMLRSYQNLLLAVRRVNQQNRGKKTASVDNRLALTPQAKWALVNGHVDGIPKKTNKCPLCGIHAEVRLHHSSQSFSQY